MSKINYIITDNFISEEEANCLIKESKTISDDDFLKIHGNRLFLSSASHQMHNLVTNFASWKKLILKINSKEFLKQCCAQLSIDDSRFRKVDYFNLKKRQEVGDKVLKNVTTVALIKYLITKFYRRILRKIKFCKIFNVNKIPVELLFDYSIASDGYYNDIHRDSDSRIIVFLLYLNTINSSGGSLSFYKKKGNQFELVETIKPMPGRLVIFLNEDHSYHGVDIMKETSGSRNFLYGSFTSLNSENPFIKEKKVRTEFNMYE
jgi:hypothetical protein